MSGRYWIFPVGAPGSPFAFDQALQATDVLALAQLTAFLAAQYMRRDVWIFDQASGMKAVGRYAPIGGASV